MRKKVFSVIFKVSIREVQQKLCTKSEELNFGNKIIMPKKLKSKQSEKARIGAIGENNVVSLLMQHGWDAFNANCTIKNYKSIDIVCIDSEHTESIDKPWKPKAVFIQVKTNRQKSSPIGFTIEQCLDNNYLEKMVMGPYVFVYANIVDGHYKFRYFIISRTQFIKLVYQSNDYYMHGYYRAKELNTKAPVALCLRWLEGISDKKTKNHRAFENPLNGISCENKWEDIWNE